NGLAATASGTAQIGLSWSASTDNAGVTGYRIERCTGAGCTSFAQVGTTSGANATTFTSTGLTPSTTYSFRRRPTDAVGTLCTYSNVASAATGALSLPDAPPISNGLAATASGTAQIGLSWSASTDNVGVTGYRIERCTGAGCSSFAQVGTTSGANA